MKIVQDGFEKGMELENSNVQKKFEVDFACIGIPSSRQVQLFKFY